ncbi:hypothetical protein [Mycolicibacterium murale]|jgi:hypothetical protein|nr:hypothetical protein [Mycolicibacterium murale]
MREVETVQPLAPPLTLSRKINYTGQVNDGRRIIVPRQADQAAP